MLETTTSKVDPTSNFLHAEERLFSGLFNQVSFEFSHNLSDHPLFELPRLLEFVKRLPRSELYYDAGVQRIDQRWDRTPPCEMSIDQLIERITDAGAWIIIRRVNQDPEYGAIMERCLDEAQSLIGKDLRNQIKLRDSIIFITSPNRISTYHIDRECSLLLQIHGEKEISVFRKDDREVLPEEEIERFWTVDHNAAIYKEEYQDRATVYDLKPGQGIHIPVNAPHWVQNKDNISISLNVNFQYHDSFLANIYRANYYIRKLGLRPTAPGRSKLRDALKSSTMAAVLPLRKAIRSLRT